MPVAILRQLAETERSPAAPVEDQHQRSIRYQIGKPAQRPRTVRQGEVGRGVTSVWDAGVVHERVPSPLSAKSADRPLDGTSGLPPRSAAA